MPDASGRLTRQEMEAVLDRGESVIHNGVHIKSKDMLPEPIELALDAVKSGDQGTLLDTEDDLDEQIAKLQGQKQALAKAASDADAKAKADAEAKEKVEADSKAKPEAK